jgi:hypothetical protein
MDDSFLAPFDEFLNVVLLRNWTWAIQPWILDSVQASLLHFFPKVKSPQDLVCFFVPVLEFCFC